jgi:Family of unknown function (DUF6101)
MVDQPADFVVTSPLNASDCIRIEACDPRSDNRRRIVDVSREAIIIRRAVAGVSMAIRVGSHAYRGVALWLTGLEDGRFHYEVRLAHRDPDLSVPLGEGDDLAEMEARWREWVAFLRLPALAGRAGSADTPVNVRCDDLARATPCPRWRGSALRRRRPRFHKRRAPGGLRTPEAAKFGRTVLFQS